MVLDSGKTGRQINLSYTWLEKESTSNIDPQNYEYFEISTDLCLY
jgi:hypothetical protein